MRRTLATLLLAVLVAATVVGPAAAGEPSPSPAEPIASASPSVEPSPDPSPPPPDPAPTPEPTAAPTAAPPTAEPTAEPTAAPPTEPTDAAPTAAPTAAPSPEPTPAALPEVPVQPPPSSANPDADPTGRFLVMLKAGADTAAVVGKHRTREGTRADRTFERAVRGFSARLDKEQRAALLADPNVLAIVPDEKVELTAQTIPTGVSRVGTKVNPIADIDNVDERVDADIAIVDTGVAKVADLNVSGYVDCTSGNAVEHPGKGRDIEGHGTHVAGTAAALDNNIGVVGMAPGARIWGVRILNDSGEGLLSWYVCGLDWILDQRDPNDDDRPLFEAVNMSVAKWGKDDGACGTENNDILHKAICRLVSGGITVVVAAANDSGSATARVPASYNEVITVSALADTDGKPGADGGNRCYSWGGYDSDDTFANFSNYGHDVDIMAPGKCIWSTLRTGSYGYMSGTSMASPTVAGAVALYKASRPMATPADVKDALQHLGNLGYKTSTDPDGKPDKLLDVSRLGNLGSFDFPASSPSVSVTDGGGTTSLPVTITRSSTHFERVRFKVGGLPSGWTATWAPSSLIGFSARTTTLNVTVPAGTRLGTYALDVTGTALGKVRSTTAIVVVGPGALWQPVTPVRRLDTRIGLGLSSRLSSGNVRTFTVAGSGIPDDAVAVTGNLTVTSATGGGYVSVGPSLSSRPGTSTINVAAGGTLANGVTAQLAAGRLSVVYVGPGGGSSAHAVFDVTGYYRTGTGNSWYGLGPTRLLDTRTGNGLGGDFTNRAVRSVRLTGRGGLPSAAVAITGNVTVTGATGTGYLSIGPTMTSSPNTSTLNFQAGRTLANNVTLKLGTGGRVSAVIVGTTGLRADVLLDVTGYYVAGDGGAHWYPVAAHRRLDTRVGTGLTGRFRDGVSRSFQVTGGSVPSDAVAVSGNLTVTGGTGAGYVAAGPTMGSSSSTSTLNVRTGQTLANGLTLRVTGGGRGASVFQGPTGSSVHLILDIVGYFR